MDEFLTVADVAELLKLNQQTVRTWINAAYHIGRRVRISRADFDRLIEQGYSRGNRTEAAPSIWDGQIQMPETPD